MAVWRHDVREETWIRKVHGASEQHERCQHDFGNQFDGLHNFHQCHP